MRVMVVMMALSQLRHVLTIAGTACEVKQNYDRIANLFQVNIY